MASSPRKQLHSHAGPAINGRNPGEEGAREEGREACRQVAMINSGTKSRFWTRARKLIFPIQWRRRRRRRRREQIMRNNQTFVTRSNGGGTLRQRSAGPGGGTSGPGGETFPARRYGEASNPPENRVTITHISIQARRAQTHPL